MSLGAGPPVPRRLERTLSASPCAPPHLRYVRDQRPPVCGRVSPVGSDVPAAPARAVPARRCARTSRGWAEASDKPPAFRPGRRGDSAIVRRVAHKPGPQAWRGPAAHPGREWASRSKARCSRRRTRGDTRGRTRQRCRPSIPSTDYGGVGRRADAWPAALL